MDVNMYLYNLETVLKVLKQDQAADQGVYATNI